MTARKRILQLGLGVVAAALLAAVQPCSASAQEVLFAETIQVERYTGTFQKEFHIDIDGDGEKEAIGYYYVGSKRDGYSISDVYSVFDTNSESYILYRRISNDHMNYKFHIIQDKNTGETFLGYIYTDMFGSEMLYRLYSDNQSKLINSYNANTDGSDKLQAYKTYMNNVDFLDEMAYGHGDVDGDADVTVSDAVAILSYYAATAAGQSPSFTEPQKKLPISTKMASLPLRTLLKRFPSMQNTLLVSLIPFCFRLISEEIPALVIRTLQQIPILFH